MILVGLYRAEQDQNQDQEEAQDIRGLWDTSEKNIYVDST